MPSIADRNKAFHKGTDSLEPYDVWPNDTDNMPPFPFPTFHATDTFQSWELTGTFYVGMYAMAEIDFVNAIRVGKGYAFLKIEAKDVIAIGEYTVKP